MSSSAEAVLDAARGTAALYVVLHHLAQRWSTPGDIPLVLRFGQEAVILFFLLSGFVIYANERERSISLRAYATRRVQRIYPTLVAALLISVCVAWFDGSLSDRFRWSQLWATLLNLQDTSALKPGVISDPFMGNTPLWSLSYEVCFYSLFPLVMLAWRKKGDLTSHAIGALGCAAYAAYALSPNHWALMLAYFPIWWTGAMAAQKYSECERRPSCLLIPLGWLFVQSVLAVVVLFLERDAYTSIGAYPALPIRHFGAGVLFAVIGFGPAGAWLAKHTVRLRSVFHPLAAISFGVYVFHYPLLITSSYAGAPVGFATSLCALVGLSIIFDAGAVKFLRRRSEVSKVGVVETIQLKR